MRKQSFTVILNFYRAKSGGGEQNSANREPEHFQIYSAERDSLKNSQNTAKQFEWIITIRAQELNRTVLIALLTVSRWFALKEVRNEWDNLMSKDVRARTINHETGKSTEHRRALSNAICFIVWMWVAAWGFRSSLCLFIMTAELPIYAIILHEVTQWVMRVQASWREALRVHPATEAHNTLLKWEKIGKQT